MSFDTKIFCRCVAVFLLLSSIWPYEALADALQLPATGVWNGFLNQQNIIECSNIGDTSLKLSIAAWDNTGGAVGNTTLKLSPHQTAHFSLNNFNITDRYGTFIISSSSASPRLTCHTTFYRLAPVGSGKNVSYAYSIAVKNPEHGVLTGTYNSMNPKAQAQPIFN